MNPERMVYEIAVWLKEQMDLANAKGYVVGLSGGVDSAVAAALAVRGVGDHKVLGFVMPIGPEKVAGGEAVARWLGIGWYTCNLSLAYHQLLADMAHMSASRVAGGNLKARLRMCCLYYWANLTNHLVLGTGNLSEIQMGYFTKYGDGGVDILPLGNLYKHKVYQLASVLDVPQEVIDRPPSAGLWPGQTDEEEMGVSYDDIFCFLSGDSHDNTPEQNIKMALMQKQSVHKRRMPPIWTGS